MTSVQLPGGSRWCSWSCCWRSPESREQSSDPWCHSEAGGRDSQDTGPPSILPDSTDTCTSHLRGRARVLGCDVTVLPSVLHLNAVTVKAPPTFFITKSQSPSTDWQDTNFSQPGRFVLFFYPMQYKCSLTVIILGRTVQLASGVGSKTWQSVSSRSTSST